MEQLCTLDGFYHPNAYHQNQLTALFNNPYLQPDAVSSSLTSLNYQMNQPTICPAPISQTYLEPFDPLGLAIDVTPLETLLQQPFSLNADLFGDASMQANDGPLLWTLGDDSGIVTPVGRVAYEPITQRGFEAFSPLDQGHPADATKSSAAGSTTDTVASATWTDSATKAYSDSNSTPRSNSQTYLPATQKKHQTK
jgi:hypothetical protein